MALGLGAVLAGGAIWALVHTTAAPQTRVRVNPTSTPTTDTRFAIPTPPATPTPPTTPIASNTTVYQIYKGHTQPIMALAWSPLDETSIASASFDNTSRIWDTTSQRVLVTHPGNAVRMVWSPNGQYIASGGTDDIIHIWQASNGADLATYPTQATQSRRDLLFTMSGILGSQRLFKSQKPWGKDTPLSGRGLQALAWSPDSKRLASSGTASVIQIWDALNGSQFISFGGTSNGVFGLVWKTDGARILAGSGTPNNTVYLWDAQTGTMLAPYPGHTSIITALAPSPDGHFFASGSADTTVRVWNENLDIPITIYTGHTDIINCIAWSPDGKRIASASSDGTVQLWDAATGGNIFIYRGHSGVVMAVD